jgi:hypothetical protein
LPHRVYGIICNAQYLHVTQIPFRQERKTMAQKTPHESQSAHQGKAPENSTSSLPLTEGNTLFATSNKFWREKDKIKCKIFVL